MKRALVLRAAAVLMAALCPASQAGAQGDAAVAAVPAAAGVAAASDVAGVAAAANVAADSVAWYPAGIGDTWTYHSSSRGEFTNQVTDTVMADGHTWYRVMSRAESGTMQQFRVRHDGGRVLQRVADGPEMLLADFSLPVGGMAMDPASGSTITFFASHDTATVLGTRFSDVRQYRSMGTAGIVDSYFARGIGLVAVMAVNSSMQSQLLSASVGGRSFTATLPPTSSGVPTRTLAPHEIGNLALLAQVWGFAKYHHPAITGGAVDWDAALLRVMPAVMDAPDRTMAQGVINRWLSEAGEPPACEPCAYMDGELHLEPELDWIRDEALLGDELSGRLQRIHRNRSNSREQRYVSLAPGVNNPVFSGEERYALLQEPDAGFRMLGLFRYWNIIRWWFPYRDLLDDDWDDVLTAFIPVVMAADSPDQYSLAMLRLAGHTRDTHATLARANALRPPAGDAMLPVSVRFVAGQATVTGYMHDTLGPATGLLPGDVILRIDGVPVDDLVAAWAPYYPASNHSAQLHIMARTLTRGSAGTVVLTVLREDGLHQELPVARVPLGELDATRGRTHDLPGETYQRLDDDVAYLKLSSIAVADIPRYMEQAADARVLVVDIRNYPSAFVVFALGGRLVQQPTPFARFTHGDTRNPGAFRWGPLVSLQPVSPHFAGTVVVLVDESSISQSEYTAMALRAGANTIIAGSTTAAADGNVSVIPLPGGFTTNITGIGVFYPDRTPTQRVGIIPDVEVRPTIAGIRAGRDEVLEAGVSAALGRAWRR